MKYLKRYENWFTNWRKQKKIGISKKERDIVIRDLKEWMNQNGLESVNLDSVGIGASTAYSPNRFDPLIRTVYKKIVIESGYVKFLVAKDSFKIEADLNTLYVIGEDSLDPEIARYLLEKLENLTPEDIKQLQTEQEAEKFNM